MYTHDQLERMNQLVAERMMGWKWVECDSKDYDGVNHHLRVLMPPEYATVENLLSSLAPRGGMSANAYLARLPMTTAIDAAWRVLKTAAERKAPDPAGGRHGACAIYGVHCCPRHVPERRWHVFLDTGLERFEAWNEDECVAICICALRAFGVDVEKELEKP